MKKPLNVALLGLGAIGSQVLRHLDSCSLPGLKLSFVSARNTHRAENLIDTLSLRPEILSIEDAIYRADVVVECLPPNLLPDVAEATLSQDKILVPSSVGGVLSNIDFIRKASEKSGRIFIPSGALAGLDGISAAATLGIKEASLVTRKPVDGFEQSDYLTRQGIDLNGLCEPVCLYRGSALEGIRLFPKNVNVAGALCLAGVSPDILTMELWACPTLRDNQHTVSVASEAGRLQVFVENRPDVDNPKTSRITAYSILATLRRITGGFVI